jgi:hypothetical protein
MPTTSPVCRANGCLGMIYVSYIYIIIYIYIIFFNLFIF